MNNYRGLNFRREDKNMLRIRIKEPIVHPSGVTKITHSEQNTWIHAGSNYVMPIPVRML